MDYNKLREEPLKSAVQQDYFKAYKYTQLGNIDFVIAKHNTEKGMHSLFEEEGIDGSIKSILWAEAKQGTNHDIYESFVQLILTIGKEKTFEKYLPPKYIGAFDAEKFAFIEYHSIQEVFYQNDFNWNVTPSNHETKEFKQLHELCENSLQENSILFKYETQSAELKEFIKLNFKTDKDVYEKISVTKNNFTFVFQRWSEIVKPTISVDWEKANKAGIISADFFLADLLSSENESLKDSLYVVLRKTKYELAKKIDDLGFETSMSVGFKDKQKAYKEFWSIYSRPPKEEYWDYIIGRRDLLVPQDIRERKGSFFTPQIWVEKSQQYLADVLGETWQDEYYIWDCCAGTGNLLNGLTNYRNVWASTLDKQDVDVMKDRISNGWSMFENHVFQFDFLNDDFSKCPQELQDILNDEEKRKRLVIYINPPYAEAANARTSSGTGENRTGVARGNATHNKYKNIMGLAQNELFALFIMRIYKEISGCYIGQFSTVKIVSYPSYDKFREIFKAKLKKMFIVPANTFDNVKGKFPIGFFVWNTAEKQTDLFTANAVHEVERKPLGLSKSACYKYESDIFDFENNFIGKRFFYADKNVKSLTKWLQQFHDKQGEKIAYLRFLGSDVQNTNGVFLAMELSENDFREMKYTIVTKKNLLSLCIYYSVRHIVEDTWITHNDQFLYPIDGWQNDFKFQGDCLIYTLFGDKNRISVTSTSLSDHVVGERSRTNHWIPFTEEQVGSKKAFKSTFMSDFIKDFLAGKIDVASTTLSDQSELFDKKTTSHFPPQFSLSKEAQAVYDSGLELWKYYHSQPKANPDAAFYDIRKFFQGESKGRMNNTSDDERYNELIGDLREKMKLLAKKIEVKVYEYGFLK